MLKRLAASGASVRLRPLRADEDLRCGRGGEAIVRRHRGDPSHQAWALSTSGLILYVLANFCPILTFDVADLGKRACPIKPIHSFQMAGTWQSSGAWPDVLHLPPVKNLLPVLSGKFLPRRASPSRRPPLRVHGV